MEKHSLVRTIYLYLFAILGLVLLTIGSVRFLNMGFKTFIFTKADQEMRLNYKMPTSVPCYLDPKYNNLEQTDIAEVDLKLTKDQTQDLKMLLANAKAYDAERAKVDPVEANNQRDAAMNLSLILIGLPLYLYHWLVIKRETK